MSDEKDLQTMTREETAPSVAGSTVTTDSWHLIHQTTTDAPDNGPLVRCDCSQKWYYYVLIVIFYVLSLFLSGAGTMYFRGRHEMALALLTVLLRLLRRALLMLEAVAEPAQGNAEDAAGKTFFSIFVILFQKTFFCFFLFHKLFSQMKTFFYFFFNLTKKTIIICFQVSRETYREM
jgi:hypothetical protein